METSHSLRNAVTRVKTIISQASDRTGLITASSRLLRKKPSMWVSTTWATAVMLLRFFSRFKSKCEFFIIVFNHVLLGPFLFCHSDLVISAQNVDGPESFLIEIEKGKVGGLLQEFDGDMGFLAQFLRLQDKRMVLINPVSLKPNSHKHFYSKPFCMFRNSTIREVRKAKMQVRVKLSKTGT